MTFYKSIVVLSMIVLAVFLIFNDVSAVNKMLVKETVTTQEIKSLEISKAHSSGLFTLGRDQNTMLMLKVKKVIQLNHLIASM